MGSQHLGLFCCMMICSCEGLTGRSSLSPYIRHYEGLSYDRPGVHRQHHLLTKRATAPHQDRALQLNFTAFHREFRLRLRRDTSGFSEEFKVVDEKGAITVNLSHLYSGTLEGEQDASCHGSLLLGQFEGSVRTSNGTYHIEPLHRYTSRPDDHHSIIYHEDDMVLPSLGAAPSGFCGAEGLQRHAQELGPEEGAPVNRSRRTVDEFKTTCMLHLQADHLYFKKFKSVEAVVAQVSSFIRAVNDIYDKVDFEGIKLINFKVKSLTVITEGDVDDPLQRLFLGPEKLLSLYSESDWGNYCLSYLLTNRDYSGVLGLAWEGKAGNWGGICSQHTTLRDGRQSSLNTGLVTLQNYGMYLPPRHFQLTLAHELGHSLGAPHDEGSNCGTLGSRGGKGRYLMFPQATEEVRENNERFSPCSIKHISMTLRLKKDDCFVVSGLPICGNHITEDGEECDVGHSSSDLCCYSAIEAVGRQCRLKPGQICSPSQGLCCGQACGFKPAGESCDEETECQRESVCTGLSPLCPEPAPKENFTVCRLNTRVCLNGQCAESLCVRHGLEQCDCPGVSMKEKCQMCCQQPDKPDTCASTTSSVLSRYFERRTVTLLPGSPCAENQGYCNKFQVCQLLYADGPIARLKNSFLHLDDFDDPTEWMKAYWWAILLALLLLSAVMGCIICVCHRTLDISNVVTSNTESAHLPKH
ncbi:disintegrin and metalloproteinase domain-containing protein 10 [Gadus chalcogrammus]|uniref:disintegrin and metalloproteinase domain-containing protein 10 n=1 Tax=Gadus chalcogrammus TaxID=1042646 RepID=UPI0024C4BF13|nr:disintegrin and metalloproteinase domain-containing protein 10 [Gadus chalcogrammus]